MEIFPWPQCPGRVKWTWSTGAGGEEMLFCDILKHLHLFVIHWQTDCHLGMTSYDKASSGSSNNCRLSPSLTQERCSHLLSVWKQEWRPTRKGWLEACSKTCFSVWTQSMSCERNTQRHTSVNERSFWHPWTSESWISTGLDRPSRTERDQGGQRPVEAGLYRWLDDNMSGHGCGARLDGTAGHFNIDRKALVSLSITLSASNQSQLLPLLLAVLLHARSITHDMMVYLHLLRETDGLEEVRQLNEKCFRHDTQGGSSMTWRTSSLCPD